MISHVAARQSCSLARFNLAFTAVTDVLFFTGVYSGVALASRAATAGFRSTAFMVLDFKYHAAARAMADAGRLVAASHWAYVGALDAYALGRLDNAAGAVASQRFNPWQVVPLVATGFAFAEMLEAC
jgi:hypothetical protein